MIDSNCPRSALYARNPVSFSIEDRLDAVYTAQNIGKRGRTPNLDVFTLKIAACNITKNGQIAQRVNTELDKK